jgi:hypothetical protein
MTAKTNNGRTKTTADACGMTNKKQATATATAKTDPYEMTNKKAPVKLL